MSDTPFRIGVLGAGDIAQAAHFPASRKAKDIELYAICDAADDLRDRMVTVHRPTTSFDDYDTMLDDENVDAVIVAVADQFHVPLAIRALEAGKHVLVEKPMGVSVEEAEDLYAAQQRAGKVVLVGHEKRYDPGIAFAHDFIRDEIGDLIGLKHWYCDFTHRYTVTDNIRPTIEQSAAPRRPAGDPKANRQRYYVLGHGSHLLDTARYLGGPITALRSRFSGKADTYCWFIEAEFENGCLGQLDLTLPVRLDDWHEGFQVYGSDGSVFGKIENPWYFKGSNVEAFSQKDGRHYRANGADGHTFRLQLEDLAHAARAGSAPRGATAEDGLASVRGMVAIARSVESGDWVRLADVEGAV